MSICLVMIVRNESKIIKRCLSAAKSIIDYVYIHDTGSDDNTVQEIKEWLNDNSVKGAVEFKAWKNFGHNRTEVVKGASSYLKSIGAPIDSTWYLTIDADMILDGLDLFNKKILHDNRIGSIDLRQINDSTHWYNKRLMRASYEWQCVGVTHEYYTCLSHPDAPSVQVENPYINDIGDGGCKGDKFYRDISYFWYDRKDDPDNSRNMFYLAQSFNCINEHDMAIEFYKRRINAGTGNNIEEVYFSYLTIGDIYLKKNDEEKAVYNYLQAYEYDPHKAEALYRLARYYREKGDNNKAYIFANQGRRIPYPKNRHLFVEYPIYDWKLDYELCIVCYYTPYKAEGKEACERLLNNDNVPANYKEMVMNNYKFYLEYPQQGDCIKFFDKK